MTNDIANYRNSVDTFERSTNAYSRVEGRPVPSEACLTRWEDDGGRTFSAKTTCSHLAHTVHLHR